MPLPMRMRGTERVKAKAPRTPSIEKVVSMASRYKILLMSLRLVLPERSSFSARSALSLNPWVIKNAVDPITAPNAMNGSMESDVHTMNAKRIETTA